MIKRLLLILSVTFFATGLCQSQAGDGPSFKSGKDVVVSDYPFEAGTKEFQALSGAYLSFTPDSSHRSTIDYAFQGLRIGYMVTSPGAPGFLRGNLEVLFEAWGGETFVGQGAGLAGGNLLFRYNFVQPGAKIVPYFQAGGGCLWNDIYHDQSQQEVGEAFEFNLQAHVGVQFLLNRNLALTLEGGYTHISNAGLASRNYGLDSLGAVAGVSVFF